MAFGLRVRVGAAAGVLALAAVVVAAPVAAGDPTPTPGGSVPSQAEVRKAQADAAAAAKEVAAIRAKVKVAEARLEALQRGVSAAVSAQEKADEELADAEAAVTKATEDLLRAHRVRDAADSSLSGTAAEMYMQGGDLQSLTTLVLAPPNVMSDLAVVIDESATRVRDDLDAATAAANDAAEQERLLTSARNARDAAAADAAAKLAAAKKAASAAGTEAARLGQKQEELAARLDELKAGAADLVNQREAAARLGRFDLLGLQASGSAPREAQEIARSMMASRGWDSGEFTCLVNLWNAESGWSWSATNPSSGAYGIPQSLPGWKMASAGSDWLTNPKTQITWGMGYIASTYGSPCNAWDKFLSRSPHWY